MKKKIITHLLAFVGGVLSVVALLAIFIWYQLSHFKGVNELVFPETGAFEVKLTIQAEHEVNPGEFLEMPVEGILERLDFLKSDQQRSLVDLARSGAPIEVEFEYPLEEGSGSCSFFIVDGQGAGPMISTSGSVTLTETSEAWEIMTSDE